MPKRQAMYRLSPKEMRIIEQTKREGEELQRQQQAEGIPVRRGTRIWALIAFIVIFLLFVLGIRLLIGLVS